MHLEEAKPRRDPLWSYAALSGIGGLHASIGSSTFGHYTRPNRGAKWIALEQRHYIYMRRR
jgi:hypothetical protein